MYKAPGRLRVGIIGSGKVGPILARAIAGAGHQITAITAAGDAAKERVSALLPGVPVLPIDEVVKQAELVLFAIPGSEIQQLVSGLTKAGAFQPGQLVVHTAAEHGYSVFNEALSAGVIPLALHPALVFTGTSIDLVRLSEATIAVTAPAPVLPIGQALAIEIGAEPVIIADSDRPAYAEAIDFVRENSRLITSKAIEKLSALQVNHPERTVLTVATAAITEVVRTSDSSQTDS